MSSVAACAGTSSALLSGAHAIILEPPTATAVTLALADGTAVANVTIANGAVITVDGRFRSSGLMQLDDDASVFAVAAFDVTSLSIAAEMTLWGGHAVLGSFGVTTLNLAVSQPWPDELAFQHAALFAVSTGLSAVARGRNG